MKTGKLLASSLLLWLALSCLNAPFSHAQNLRAATSSSYLERGNEWFAKGEYARAEADFTEAIALQPRSADSYAQRGMMRLLQNRAAEAQSDFDHCLELNPKLRSSLEQKIAAAKRHLATKQ